MTEGANVPPRIDWTPEQIQRFWDWHAAHPATQALYFSKLAGDALLDTTKKFVKLQGVALDVGAGPGYLTQKLVARGVKTFAVDTSAESVAKLEARLGAHENFLGARSSTMDHIPFADGLGDLAFVIETVEHLDEAALRALLRETHRVLKRKGVVVVTTPNEEDLSALEHFCPNCGVIFHRWQHVRAWSARTLENEMQQHGFETMACYPTLFSDYPVWVRPLHRLAITLQQQKFPHLLYVGRKP